MTFLLTFLIKYTVNIENTASVANSRSPRLWAESITFNVANTSLFDQPRLRKTRCYTVPYEVRRRIFSSQFTMRPKI